MKIDSTPHLEREIRDLHPDDGESITAFWQEVVTYIRHFLASGEQWLIVFPYCREDSSSIKLADQLGLPWSVNNGSLVISLHPELEDAILPIIGGEETAFFTTSVYLLSLTNEHRSRLHLPRFFVHAPWNWMLKEWTGAVCMISPDHPGCLLAVPRRLNPT